MTEAHEYKPSFTKKKKGHEGQDHSGSPDGPLYYASASEAEGDFISFHIYI